MKLLMTSAALLALAVAAPMQAQVVGGAGAGLNSPAGTLPLGATASGQVNAPTNVGPPILPSAGDTARGAIQNGAPTTQGATNDAKTTSQGAIKDGRTLNTGTASIDASANVSDSGTRSQALLAGGMNIQDMGGMTLGKVISVTKSRSGQVTNVIVQTADGVRRTMAPGGLTVKGGVAVTSQSQADLATLPVVR
jgi:hypothetical protein